MDVRGGVKMRMAAALAAIGYIRAVMTCADGAESMSRAAPADRLNEFRSTLLGPPWQKQKFALQWAMSALGQKRTLAVHKPMSALPPHSDRKSGHPMVQTLWGGVRCQTSFVAANEAALNGRRRS